MAPVGHGARGDSVPAGARPGPSARREYSLVLLLGLVNMLRQGSANKSQTLMRWRVGLQFLAIVVIVLVLWTRGH